MARKLQRIAATPAVGYIVLRTEAFIHQHRAVLRNGTRLCGDRLRRADLGWQKSWKLNLPRRYVFPQAGFELEAYAALRIYGSQYGTRDVLL